jgi:anti-sigma regulatory factor (Ser/Thr protein kinase)
MSTSDRRIRALETISVSFDVHVFVARQAVRRCAEAVGFGRIACGELIIAASELASNILKYGIRGEITIEPVMEKTRGAGIRIVARDIGPQFHDLETALRDGHGDRGPVDPAVLLRRGGLGSGLGAVVRFTDTFEHEAEAVGKKITVVRYVRRSAARNQG